MAMAEPNRASLEQILKLVNQLTLVEQQELCRKLVDKDGGSRRSNTATALELTSPQVHSEFTKLAKVWREQAGGQSSPLKQSMHPAYQQIIGMGKQVVPLILKELKEKGGQWYWALGAITGDNPIDPQDAGNISKMKASWLDYGKARHLI
jgi:hypothetical protein